MLPAPGKPADFDDFVLGRRFRLFQKYCAPVSDPVVLDFGSGTGGMSHYFAPVSGRFVAMDVNEAYLETLRRSHQGTATESRVTTVCADAGRLPFEDGEFDLVVSFEVIEHVPDEKAALREIFRVLKPGGQFFFTIPNKWWIFETHGANLPLLPWNRVPGFGWLPKAIHDKYALARNYTKPEIRHLLEAAGLIVGHLGYMTAPMDVLKKAPRLQEFLRSTFFHGDETGVPILSTSLFAFGKKQGNFNV